MYNITTRLLGEERIMLTCLLENLLHDDHLIIIHFKIRDQVLIEQHHFTIHLTIHSLIEGTQEAKLFIGMHYKV